nr:methylenetetrahydrofolate reductase [Nodosilinea sp. LEGE 07088]
MNYFRQAVVKGDFLITAEIMPPKGANPDRMLTLAKLLKGRVHAVNVTDGSRSVLRMSSIAASTLLLQQGIEPICQMTCRDRNIIALQSDLMGAQALGIRNILALTGDPVHAGDQKGARAVFELESVRLLNLIEHLNAGTDASGNRLSDGHLDIFPGAAVDPQLKSWSSVQRRFERKLMAGAQFFQSQMIVDFDRLEMFMSQLALDAGKPIIAGIFLLKSAQNADFINRHVPGVHIPDEIIQRLASAVDPLRIGIEIVVEQIAMAKQYCQGIHLMAVRREELIPEILEQAGILPIEHMKNCHKLSA